MHFRTEKGYPLHIRPSLVLVEEAPVDRDLLQRILGQIDYAALLLARAQLVEHCRDQHHTNNNNDDNTNNTNATNATATAAAVAMINLPELPPTLPDPIASMDDATAASLFRLLFEIHVQEGLLVCPDTGREFPIKDGIPNMILHEDEL